MPAEAVVTAPAPVVAPAAPAPDAGGPKIEGAKETRAWIRNATAKMLADTAAETSPAPPAAEPAEPAEATEPAETEPEAEAEADKGKEKKGSKKEVTPEPPPPNELEAMRQQATRLGFVVEDGRVTTKERADFRSRHREAAAQRAELEKELSTRFESKLSEYKPKFERADQLTAAIEQGDHDAVAKVLNFENWDKLIEDQIARKADPNYQRLRALEEAHAARARQDEERAVAEQKRQAERAETEARATYIRNLSGEMKGSKDPLIAAFADDGGFVQTIFAIQSAHYRETGELMSAEQAAQVKAPGAAMTPKEALRGLYDRLSKVYGAPAATPPPAPAPPNGAAKPRPAPRTSAPKKAGAAPSRDFDRRGWFQDSERRMREAFAQDDSLQKKG